MHLIARVDTCFSSLQTDVKEERWRLQVQSAAQPEGGAVPERARESPGVPLADVTAEIFRHC